MRGLGRAQDIPGAQELHRYYSSYISFAPPRHDCDLPSVICLVNKIRECLARFADGHAFHAFDYCTAGTKLTIRTVGTNCTIRRMDGIMPLIECADRGLGSRISQRHMAGPEFGRRPSGV